MEELKVITEALGGLGSEAKTAFIVWVIAKYGLHYFAVMGIFAGLFYTILRVATAVISKIAFINQIKAIMGYRGDLTKYEREEILDLLNEAKKKQ